MALGALVFIPAAMTRTYGLFLAGRFQVKILYLFLIGVHALLHRIAADGLER